MNPYEANVILTQYESNLYADLYKSRWDAEFASSVVPNLINCLSVDDKSVLLRTLSALNRIGPEANAAGPYICPLLEHSDSQVQINAIWALSAVFYRQGEEAIAPLVKAANDPALLKHVMFGLIFLGREAKSTKDIFIAAYDNHDGRMRRLAIRGLREIGAEGLDVIDILKRALCDKNSQVRSAAVKLAEAVGFQSQLTLPKDEETKPAKKPKKAKATKTPWPKERSQRTKAIQDALAATPITPADLAKQFLRGNAGQIEDILDALYSLGLARKSRGKYSK